MTISSCNTHQPCYWRLSFSVACMWMLIDSTTLSSSKDALFPFVNAAFTTMISSSRCWRNSAIDRSATSLYSSSRKRSNRNDDNILDDGEGHINPELATILWNWEQEQRLDAHMPKMPYSSRTGLRLVKEVVGEICKENNGGQSTKSSSSKGGRNSYGKTNESDLIQEGIMALMDAMNQYRKFSQDKEFEDYARSYISQRLQDSLQNDYSPILMPSNHQVILRKVQQLKPKLKQELGGEREPTTAELAAKIGISEQALDQCLKQAKNTPLSMESTIEILDPLLEGLPHFKDLDEWESKEGHLLTDTAGSVVRDELVDDYIDDMYTEEGEDEMWVHQEQIAAPLRDIIPDREPTPDDIALSEMIKYDVEKFLSTTLDSEETKIVRMRFGLETGKPMKQTDIGAKLRISPTRVHHILVVALEKLRESYTNQYVETYLDNEDDDVDDSYAMEDSV